MSLIKKMFLKSPLFLKKILINFEALHRDYYRRWGDYQELFDETSEDKIFSGDYKSIQKKLFLELIAYVKDNVPGYGDSNNIDSLDDIIKFPILTKQDLMYSIDSYLSKEVDRKDLYRGTTSGSTGKPLVFYKDRESVRNNYVYVDKMNEIVGLTKEDVKCRFSGVNLFEFNKKTPPFWIYISKYRQLQCSSYHLDESNFSIYLKAMIEHGVTFGTGYANTWLFLAEYILKNDCVVPKFKAIVTDSEGITNDQQDIIEKAFRCKVYQTYGLGEVGQIAFQCRNRNYHIIPQTAFIEMVDDNFSPVKEGTIGQIVITSLYSKKTPFIRYVSEDIGKLSTEKCSCGWNTPYFIEIIGRTDDYILINDGRKIGRLSHIIKPAKGVINSQLIQTSIDNLAINIIPDNTFDEGSMDDVIRNARDYLGGISMNWQVVDKLERTSNGKIKHVIRKF